MKNLIFLLFPFFLYSSQIFYERYDDANIASFGFFDTVTNGSTTCSYRAINQYLDISAGKYCIQQERYDCPDGSDPVVYSTVCTFFYYNNNPYFWNTMISCASPNVIDRSTGNCVAPGNECPAGEELNSIGECVPIPCPPENFVSPVDGSCSQFPKSDTDLDGDGIPNDIDDDIDGDGVSNDIDDDIDGDGIPNNSDNTPFGDNDNGVCSGIDNSSIQSGYVYYNTVRNLQECGSSCRTLPNLMTGNYLIQSDPTCNKIYCFCEKFNECASEYLKHFPLPSEEYEYKSIAQTDSSCYLIMINSRKFYDGYFFKTINTNCGLDAFCYVHLNSNPPDLNNSEPDYKIEDNRTIKITDINTTSDKVNYEGFSLLGKKLDKNNFILDEILKSNNLRNDALDSINNRFLKLDDSIKSLDNTAIKDNINKTNSKLDMTNSKLDMTNSKLDTINNNLVMGFNSINNNLFDPNLQPIETTDGSEFFNDIEQTASSSFSSFFKVDALGLNSQTYQIPTLSFNILNKNFVLFDSIVVGSGN